MILEIYYLVQSFIDKLTVVINFKHFNLLKKKNISYTLNVVPSSSSESQ